MSVILSDRFKAIFGRLDSILGVQTGLANVPVIGAVLPAIAGGLFGTRVNSVADALAALDPAATLAQIRDAINANGAGFVTAVVESSKIRLTISITGQQTSDTLATGFSIGGTNLGLGAQISFTPSIAQVLRFDLLYDPNTGDFAYVDRPGNEVTVTVAADLAFNALGTIGAQSITVTDIHAGPEISVSLGLDFAQLDPGFVTVSLTGTVDTKNRILLDLGEDLPSVRGDLSVHWTMGGGSPTVELTDIGVRLGDLIAAVAEALDPLVQLFATTPFKEFYQALVAPLPIVDSAVRILGQVEDYDFVPGPFGDGKIGALDLVARYMAANNDPNLDGVIALTAVIDLLRQIDELKQAGANLGDSWVNLGSFRLTSDPINPFQSLLTPQQLAALEASAEAAINSAFDLANQFAASTGEAITINGKSLGTFLHRTGETAGVEARSGIYFPIFEDQGEILKFLFPDAFPEGEREADFFRVDLVEHFDHEDFNLYGQVPFVFTLEQKFYAGIDLSVGYDTFGLRPGKSPEDGIFVRAGGHLDDSPHAVEGAAAYIDFQFGVGAGFGYAGDGVGAGVLVEGGITGDKISLFLQDGGYRPTVGGPVFGGLSGRITADLNLLFVVDFGPVEISHRLPLVRETIINFDRPRIGDNKGLGSALTGGELSGLFVNAGQRVDQRLIVSAAGEPIIGYNLDNDERFSLANGGAGQVIVKAFNIDDEHLVPNNLVVAQMGLGDDTLEAQGNLIYQVRAAGNQGDDLLVGGGAADTLFGDSLDDADPAQQGNDDLYGGVGNDVLHGGPGRDRLDGGDGADTMDGGAGTDVATYEKTAAAITLSPATVFGVAGLVGGGGAAGDQLVEIEQIIATAYADTITVGARPGGGGYVVDGGDGNDILQGGDGDDVLIGGLGADTLGGGNGADGVSYLGSKAAVTIDLALSLASGGEAAGDSFASIERVQGSMFADTLSGDGGANLLDGFDGDDVLDGRGGEDVLLGADGADTVHGGTGGGRADGGAGRDLLTFERIAAAGVTVDLLAGQGPGSMVIAGAVSLVIDAGTGLPRRDADGRPESVPVPGRSSFEDLTGSNQADTLTGDAGGNVIRGLAGIDLIHGGDGNDTLHGGDAADQLFGDAGDDAINTDAGDDFADGGLGVDTITGGAGANLLRGGDGNDVVRGGDGVDTLHGDDGNDTLEGGAGGDTLHGGLGQDDLFGQDGDDTLNGDAGDDALGGGSGNDVAFGGEGSDGLLGEGGDDRLVGGTGSDTLTGGLGTDILDAGTGLFTAFGGERTGTDPRGRGIWDEGPSQNDQLIVDQSDISGGYVLARRQYVFIDGSASFFGWEGLARDTPNGALSTARGIHRIVFFGGSGTDRIGHIEQGVGLDLVGRLTDHSLDGAPGDDEIHGGGGADYLHGGLGNDRLFGDDGADSLHGGAGNDWIETGSGGDFNAGTNLSSLWTSSFAVGGDGDDTITGGIDGNVLTGANGNDTLHGLGGNDTLYGDRYGINLGTAGNDVLNGGDGNDYLDPGLGIETIDGGAGIDILVIDRSSTTLGVSFFSDGTVGSDGSSSINVERLTYLAGSGNDIVSGTVGQDEIRGNDGDDTLYGGGDVDLLFGGAGNDWIETGAASASGGNSAQGGAGNDTLIGGDGIDGLSGDEGNDTLRGMGGNDVLNSGLGTDTIFGGEGNDIVTVGLGVWTVDGEGGTDQIDVNRFASTADYVFTLNEDPGGGSSAVNFEVLRYFGGSGVDVVTGGNLVDLLQGGSGNNRLFGLGGNDTIEAGSGNDYLDGGTGRDLMFGYGGDDVVVIDDVLDRIEELPDQGTDSVHSWINHTLGNHFENLVLLGAAALDGTGNSVANRITGNSGNNVLIGGAGADTLMGGAGNDTLIGGADLDRLEGGLGDDLYLVDELSDVLVELAGEGSDTVRTGLGYALAAEIERLELTGTASIDGSGNGSNNVIVGNSGANVLSGESGDDEVQGLNGDDRLHGGDGVDTAVFRGAFSDYSFAEANGILTVTDLRPGIDGTDRIDGFEFLRFSDGTYSTAAISAPAPVAGADSLTGIVEATDLDPGVPTGTGNVLANDSSAAAGLRVTAISSFYQPTIPITAATRIGTHYGYLTIGPNGDYLYELDNPWHETDHLNDDDLVADVITYEVTDANGRRSIGQLTISIQGVSEFSLTIEPDYIFVTANRLSRFDPSFLLYNDTLTGGDTLVLVSVTDTSSNGDLLFDNGSLTLIAAGASQFSYQATGGSFSGSGDISLETRTSSSGDDLIFSPGGATASIFDGGDGQDEVYGSEGPDQLYGGNGNDYLDSSDNADLLDGGPGNDTMYGGRGDDTYIVDSVSDVVFELASQGTDTVRTTLGDRADPGSAVYVLPAQVENLVGTLGSAQKLEDNALDNVITTTAGADFVYAYHGGNDTVSTGAGTDFLYFGGTFDNADTVDGGAGVDRLGLYGDYVLTFGATALNNIERLMLYSTAGNDFDYDLTTVDANVAAGAQLEVVALALGATETLTFNGSAETNGTFWIRAGAGNDVLIGGAGGDRFVGGLGGDRMTGGGGADRFDVTAANQSTGVNFDTLIGFDATADRINIAGVVSGWGASQSGALSIAGFDAALAAIVDGVLGASGAVKVTATSGDLAGKLFIVVDANADGNYTAGSDYVFAFEGAVQENLEAFPFFV